MRLRHNLRTQLLSRTIYHNQCFQGMLSAEQTFIHTLLSWNITTAIPAVLAILMFHCCMWDIDIRGPRINWCSFISMKKLCFFDYRNMQDQLYYVLQVPLLRGHPFIQPENIHHWKTCERQQFLGPLSGATWTNCTVEKNFCLAPNLQGIVWFSKQEDKVYNPVERYMCEHFRHEMLQFWQVLVFQFWQQFNSVRDIPGHAFTPWLMESLHGTFPGTSKLPCNFDEF